MKRKSKDITLIIKIPYTIPYLYMRKGSGPQRYVAKLNETDIIANKLQLSKSETLDLLIDLIRQRLKRTRKDSVKKVLETILFDLSLTLDRFE